MKFLISLLALLFSINALASKNKTLKIAVIDTGLDITDSRLSSHLCPTGHKDFTGEGLVDTIGHGTHITGLIEYYAENNNYCLLIYKYFSYKNTSDQNMKYELASLQEAVKNGADIVNFSGGGPIFDETEYLIIRDNPNITFVVAAGNEGKNLDVHGNEYYPASYFLRNEKVVINITNDGVKADSSNYSKRATDKEVGQFVLSTIPRDHAGHTMAYMSGSSQATAIKTGKLIKEKLNAKQSFSK